MKSSVHIVSQKSGFMVNVILAISIYQCFNIHITILRPPKLYSDVLFKIANLSKYMFEQFEDHIFKNISPYFLHVLQIYVTSYIFKFLYLFYYFLIWNRWGSLKFSSLSPLHLPVQLTMFFLSTVRNFFY